MDHPPSPDPHSALRAVVERALARLPETLVARGGEALRRVGTSRTFAF